MDESDNSEPESSETDDMAVRCDGCGRALGGQRQNTEFEDGYFLLCQSCTINFHASQANGMTIEAFIQQAIINNREK